ncbi:MAG: class I SAM-dependent methyltransferase [Ignavibacteriae bacterium]|nr:class I SAM-dependent methyltransferase [Ignavibacteria bacterium]MBI3364019.1 class I SAM-dependent methyltransferase [Ignavibacteriota bacterium]
MARHPYKMYHPIEEVQALDTHGQSWRGDRIDENIELCRFQLIEPHFRKYLPKNGKILEAGCGLGRWVFYLRKLGYDIIGIDLAADAVRIAKEYDPTAPIFSDNILQTTFPEKTFDAVISLGVVEHFEEGPQKAFQEAVRVLKDNGLFLVTVPIQNTSRLLIANRLKELKRWLRKRKGAQYIFEEYRYTRQEFDSLLRRAGFDIVECVPDDFTPPKNIGLHVDYPFFRHRNRKWELNAAGRTVKACCNLFSPWIVSAGALWMCRKR